MADEIRTAKTETIGPVAIEKLTKLDAWKTYKAAFDKFSEIKDQAHHAKKKMREVLKAKLVDEKKVEKADDIDFTFDEIQDRIVIFKRLVKTGGGKRTAELDVSF